MRQFSGQRPSRHLFEKTKKTIFKYGRGKCVYQICVYQICIVFRLFMRCDTEPQTCIQVRIGISPTDCFPHVDLISDLIYQNLLAAGECISSYMNRQRREFWYTQSSKSYLKSFFEKSTVRAASGYVNFTHISLIALFLEKHVIISIITSLTSKFYTLPLSRFK